MKLNCRYIFHLRIVKIVKRGLERVAFMVKFVQFEVERLDLSSNASIVNI